MSIVMIQTSKKYYSSKDTTYMNSFDKMTIYPLDFEEYLLVRDKYLYINIKNHFENGKRINKTIKEDIFEIFKEYLVIGGLPEVVVTYIETKNYGITKDVIQLKHFEIPETLEFLEELHRTKADKVDYRLLEELAKKDIKVKKKELK